MTSAPCPRCAAALTSGQLDHERCPIVTCTCSCRNCPVDLDFPDARLHVAQLCRDALSRHIIVDDVSPAAAYVNGQVQDLMWSLLGDMMGIRPKAAVEIVSLDEAEVGQVRELLRDRSWERPVDARVQAQPAAIARAQRPLVPPPPPDLSYSDEPSDHMDEEQSYAEPEQEQEPTPPRRAPPRARPPAAPKSAPAPAKTRGKVLASRGRLPRPVLPPPLQMPQGSGMTAVTESQAVQAVHQGTQALERVQRNGGATGSRRHVE